MKTKAEMATASLAAFTLVFSLVFAVGDGGNIDFYWKPLLAAWLALTAFSFVLKKEKKTPSFIRKAWWLQIIVPVVLFFISIGLVSIYEPHPFRSPYGKNTPNQSPETTTMAGAPAASHPSRQP